MMKLKRNLSKSIVSLLLTLSMLIMTPFYNVKAEEVPNASNEDAITTSTGASAEAVSGGAIGMADNKFIGNGFEATYSVDSQWKGGFNGSITIKNTGNATIENWCIVFESFNNINNIWNASIVSYENNKYTIKNAQWNQDILPGESVSFGFSATGDTVDIPDIYSLLGSFGNTQDSSYSVNYIIDSDWGNGFTGRIEIHNKSDKPIEDWSLDFDFENDISNIWNAKVMKHTDNHYTVNNAGYNQNIAAGATVSLGFIVQSGDATKTVQNIKLSNSNLDTSVIDVTIDATPFVYYESNDFYAIGNEKISTIGGTLTADLDKISSFTYSITDEAGSTLRTGNINISENWAITDFSFCLGINTLTVTAQSMDGSSVSKSIRLACGNWDYAEGLQVDTADNDGDGLINYLETYYKTDKDKADSDGDSLNDYVELATVDTDPLKVDTNGNGVSDADEDCDADGIANANEIELGLDPAYYDSDYDTLSDYDEIYIYKTNPLNNDTDEDGAFDNWELENGTNPLEANSSFSVTSTYTSENQTVIPSVTVNNISGNQIDSLAIEEVTDNPLINENIPGYIGSAYNFSINGSFDSAELSFKFDESLLSNADFVPAIYYYNEESQTFEELENQTITGNVVSATTTHFSTYILLNKKEFDKVWEEDIKGPGSNAKHLRIGFVVDVSGSMDGTKMNTAKTVLNNFISNLGEEDQAALIKFNSSATTVVPITSNKTTLTNGVNNLSAGGMTAIYNGISKALAEFTSSGATDMYDTIIVLTDGYDEPSVTYENNYASLVNDAIEKKVTIYTVGISTVDEALLTKIAEQTGGKYYLSSVTSELEECFDSLKEETVDYITDSNSDGISDYYTKLMCEGKLTTGTGIPLFNGLSYDVVQANRDYDSDQVSNGNEVAVTRSSSGKTYLKLSSSPVLTDTDSDGLLDLEDPKPLVWNMCDRDLSIFAALAYEDGTNFVNKMYAASDILGTEDEPGENYYFLNGASLATTDIGISSKWKIVDYVNKWADIDTYFSATTFKNGNNVVISYRGTNEKIGEWVNNIVGVGLLNYHSEEGYAKSYALKIAEKYPTCNIYITGHSLGGYLAQFGAAELLKNRSVNLKEVAYFNGIGLKYNKLLFWTKNTTMDYLKDYYNKGGTLISYYIKGDVVSALGTHSGEKIGFLAAPDALNHHSGIHGSGTITDFLSKAATGWLCIFTGENLAQYYEYYHVKSVMEYFWVTHETDSFYYYLSQGTRSAY